MRCLDQIIRASSEKAVKDFIASDKMTGLLDGAIRSILAEEKYAWFWFVKAMQAELQRVSPKMTGHDSFYTARNAYLSFLKDDGIEFGDPRYDWSDDGARVLIHECEISYWESET